MVDQRDQATLPATDHPVVKTENQILRDDLEVLRQHVEALEQAQAQQDLATPDQARAIADLKAAVATLRADMDQQSRRQEQQKQEIIDSISAKMADLLKKQAASRPASRPSAAPSYNGTAREHTVQSGETLSAIAKAYGSSVGAIKRANNMDSDTVRVGQKLVVPVKE